MNKFYRPFLLTVVLCAIGFFVNAISQPFDWLSIDISLVLILFISIVSEANHLIGQNSIKHSLTAPLTLFLAFYKPLILCYFVIIIFETIGKLVGVKRDGNSKYVFDEKWLFNVSQGIVLVSFSSFYITKITIEPTGELILNLICVLFLYYLLNFILTYIIISFRSNVNYFRSAFSRNFINYILSSLMILVALIFSYEAYNWAGIVVASFFILQTQGSIITNLTAKELSNRLSVDKMTNAFNRNYFDEIIEMNIFRKKPFSILFIDLDDFKLVNDAYGHVIGDALLIDFVAIIKSLLRKENQLFRYGGDEFCIIFDNTEQAKGVHKRLEEFVFMFHDEKSEVMIYYHISLGLYDYTGDAEVTYSELIHQVDQNMYTDKRRKKSTEKEADSL